MEDTSLMFLLSREAAELGELLFFPLLAHALLLPCCNNAYVLAGTWMQQRL